MNSSASRMPSWAEEMVAPVVGGNKLVAAQLLHDEAGHAHPDAGAQNGQQAGQARDDEDLHLLKIACQNLAWRQINDSDEQRTARQSKQQYKQKNGGSILFDKKRSPSFSRLVITNLRAEKDAQR